MIFFNSYQLSLVHRITFTALMLSLVLIFQYIERFIPLGFGYLKLNFSLLFILSTFYLCNFRFGFLLFIIRYLWGIALTGFNLISLVSQASLFLSEFFTVLMLYLYSHLFKDIHFQRGPNFKKFLIISLTILSTTIFNTLLNVWLFLPLFLVVVSNFSISFNLDEIMTIYSTNLKVLFFGIPNYWAGTISVYAIGNLIKFISIFILYWPLSKFLKQVKYQDFS